MVAQKVLPAATLRRSEEQHIVRLSEHADCFTSLGGACFGVLYRTVESYELVPVHFSKVSENRAAQ